MADDFSDMCDQLRLEGNSRNGITLDYDLVTEVYSVTLEDEPRPFRISWYKLVRTQPEDLSWTFGRQLGHLASQHFKLLSDNIVLGEN